MSKKRCQLDFSKNSKNISGQKGLENQGRVQTFSPHTPPTAANTSILPCLQLDSCKHVPLSQPTYQVDVDSPATSMHVTPHGNISMPSLLSM